MRRYAFWMFENLEETYVEKLAGFVADAEFKDLPKEAANITKQVFLDELGCMIAAESWKKSRMLIDHIKSFGGVKESSILVNGCKTTSANAALVNGVMARLPDFDPGVPGVAHPGARDIPAALSIIERDRATGKDLITSFALAYETVYRIYSTLPVKALYTRKSPITKDATAATLGATASAAKALKLDANGLINALCWSAKWAPIAPFEAGYHETHGWGAFIGVNAALLAQKGATAPKTSLEGEAGLLRVFADELNLEKLIEKLGKVWHFDKIRFKLHAAEGSNQEPLEAVLELVMEHNIKPNMVENVTLFAPEYTVGSIFVHTPIMGDVQTRDFPYLCAVAITERRKITPDDYLEPRISDPKLFELAKKVGYVETETTIPLKKTVEIKLKDGKTLKKEGKPLPPTTLDDTKDRFRSLASKAFEGERIEQIIEEIDRLEKIGDITELVALLVR